MPIDLCHQLNGGAVTEKFETVHMITDWFDGPIHGIADFDGSSHVFQCLEMDPDDGQGDVYLLSPIDVETLNLASERQQILQRWYAAFSSGEATEESHPKTSKQPSIYGA